ncbi:NAD-dependent succinate-semialdehyde dehydrogenase [Aspergillus fischeri NRRL 181]|uniref:Succinate-semialdehyde dehydrogenase, mitochondrial n=1 Tax=Neosartorya fischeri (strain ATCC 1020 / DSM 3700 / CBS 544.65 / FGSC A1164 / JCM 1740 / NRRL 181 / WB 181) TaxID=331117 RepID=A1DJZ1_NEOFI|nr:succinate semialdehyde dehydrogenase [Aspergillus fischeri NRRL 181]EAW17030.1 succinate semialdehyde dehydrogenase [Aspergillus fischeri NRRL 181]
MSSYTETIQKLSQSGLFIQNSAFIDGRWLETETTFDVYDPSTGQVLGTAANSNMENMQTAIQSAQTAQQEYFTSTTAAARGALLQKWHDLVMANIDNLATLLCLENGKTLVESHTEIAYAASFISWFAAEAPRAYGDTIPSSTMNTVIMTLKEPVGVCGIITPWNFPAAMITRKIAPALGAGCAVVVKPPSETPFTALALAKLAVQAGFPGRVVQVIPTKDRSVASEVAVNPLIRKISFTGSTRVGKALAKLAAGSLKKVSLELGGNAPFIVFEDADLDLAVEGAMMSKFRCSGQTCVCTNRIYVARPIVEEFTRRLVQRVQELKCGPGLEGSSTQGPLINAAAVEKVKEHIADAVSKDAEVRTGGVVPEELGNGFFIQPTVISGATADMAVAREETFGPLAPIFEFDSEEEVVKLANETEFGLAGYFYSRDVARVLRVAQKLQVGMCGVNTGKISAAEAPFGGIKESGYGLEGSKYGMAEYQTIKTVTIGNVMI